MTANEELTYLFGILSEASKWTASPDDNRDLVRMEVEERIHNLINGIEPEPDENGDIQSSMHPDNLPAESEYLTGSEYPESVDSTSNRWKKQIKWRADKVRVFIDGKHVWKPREECIKQQRDNSKGGPRWTWKWIGPQDKKAQEEEAMWAEHEAGNASC